MKQYRATIKVTEVVEYDAVFCAENDTAAEDHLSTLGIKDFDRRDGSEIISDWDNPEEADYEVEDDSCDD